MKFSTKPSRAEVLARAAVGDESALDATDTGVPLHMRLRAFIFRVQVIEGERVSRGSKRTPKSTRTTRLSRKREASGRKLERAIIKNVIARPWRMSDCL